MKPLTATTDRSELPSWRGWIHTAAFLLSIPLGLALVLAAGPAEARAAAAIYVATLVAGFGTSAAYHRLARSPGALRWMRRADHSTIYLLIAGTYTPICLLALPAGWGLPVLAVVWVGAVVGAVLKLVAFDRAGTRRLGALPRPRVDGAHGRARTASNTSGRPNWPSSWPAGSSTRPGASCWPSGGRTRHRPSSATTRSGTPAPCWRASATSRRSGR